jgi:hypothetical protein
MKQKNRYSTTLTIEIEHALNISLSDIREMVLAKIQPQIDPLVDDGCSGIMRIKYSLTENFNNIIESK